MFVKIIKRIPFYNIIIALTSSYTCVICFEYPDSLFDTFILACGSYEIAISVIPTIITKTTFLEIENTEHIFE